MSARKSSGSSASFEDSLRKLEALVKRLEEEEIPLETSLKLFAEGQTLARACEQQLRAAENQVRQLLETESGKIEEAPLDLDTDADAEDSEDEEGESDEADPPPRAAESKERSARKRGKDELPF